MHVNSDAIIAQISNFRYVIKLVIIRRSLLLLFSCSRKRRSVLTLAIVDRGNLVIE
jgi:hypothetical protein